MSKFMTLREIEQHIRKEEKKLQAKRRKFARHVRHDDKFHAIMQLSLPKGSRK
jgi:hypothetical protein